MDGIPIHSSRALPHRHVCVVCLCLCSDVRVQKVRPNELMFAPFAHIKGSLFTLYDLVLGYTTHIMPRFHLDAYLQHIANNKVTPSQSTTRSEVCSQHTELN